MTLTHARKFTPDLIPAERYTAAMGLVYADIELTNAGDAEVAHRGFIRPDEVRRTTVTALVDSGAYTLAINERIRQQLGLEIVDSETGSLADGSRVTIPIASAVEVRFENRNTICRPMVLPGDAEILLGAIPMEGMDLVVDLRHQMLLVNPLHPDRGEFKLKQLSFDGAIYWPARTDPGGLTLYTFDNDTTEDKSACSAGSLSPWLPVPRAGRDARLLTALKN
jgi:clan AA aspartic protease